MMTVTHDDYKIAWICALSLEAGAAHSMLDRIHNSLPIPSTDSNAYQLGELNGHYIVIACLPTGVYGTASAAAAVARMQLTFPRLQYGLMVGIGGGVPDKDNDIRLGDVVVSKPVGKYSGVIQYDYGKAISDGRFEPTGNLNKPPQVLLTHMGQLDAKQITGGKDALSKIVEEALTQNPNMRERYSPPQPHTDFLFDPSYHHVAREASCEKCDKERLQERQPRKTRTPQIHYGLIASGNQVIKDSEKRDRLAKEYGILCFEMEAAGIMNELPTLVIRGISDYCDSHKQNQWQGYAALTAAAYTKLLLSIIPISRTHVGIENKKLRHWMVPLARNPNLVGRQAEITKLEELITMQGGPKKIAISGLGGVGKTQIALELAYRIRDHDQECSIFWLPCTSYEVIEQTYMDLAQMLGLHDVNPAQVKEQVKTYLSSERAGKWLLIFDNADDMDMWIAPSDVPSALKSYLPRGPQGYILFTSRNQQLATKLVGPVVIQIPEMDNRMAKDLLRVSLNRKELLDDHQATASLIQQLSFLPLAIIQAAAYINETQISLATYLSLLQEKEDDVMDLLSRDFEDDWRYQQSENPVAVTWFISFRQVQKLNPLAAEYLTLMSCIDPQEIPQSILPVIGSKIKLQDAFGLLKAYSFISMQSDNGPLSLHPLVHLATRNWLTKQGSLCDCTTKMGLQLNKVFPKDDHERRMAWRSYMPHAQRILQSEQFKSQKNERHELLNKVGMCLLSDGRYGEAEKLFVEFLEETQKEPGKEDLNLSDCIANLATALHYQGRWNEAKELWLSIVDVCGEKLGPDHLTTITGINNLAMIYCDQEMLKDAEELLTKVVNMCKDTLGPEDSHTLVGLNNLGLVYQKQGRFKDAESLFQSVMEHGTHASGQEHPLTMKAMYNLSAIYRDQGRLEEARNLSEQTVQTSKNVLGPEHPDTLTGMFNLALIYKNQKQLKEAEELLIEVTQTMKSILGPEHPHTLTSMRELAATYQSQERWNDAQNLLVEELDIRLKVLDPAHPVTLNTMVMLATIYWKQGQYEEVEKLEKRVVDVKTDALGLEHSETLTAMANLASTYQKLERWEEAEFLQKQVLEIWRRTLGPEHQETLTMMANLATTYQNQDRWGEAEELQTQVLEAWERTLDPERPELLAMTLALIASQLEGNVIIAAE